MRIGIIIPSLDDSGAARAASNLSHLLSERHEVHIITVYRHEPLQNWSGDFHVLDVPAASQEHGIITRAGLFINRLRALRRIKSELELDVSISISEALGIQNILTATADRPIVNHHTVLSRNENLADIYGRIVKTMVRIIYPRAEGIVCVSEESARDLTDHYGINPDLISVIPNSVPVCELADRMSMPEGWDDVFRDPVIVTAGRLTYAKGQWHLLRVFSELKKTMPQLKLMILGDGELRGYLHRLARGLGLETFTGGQPDDYDVYFMGFQRDPYGFIGHSDLFVLPSLREALPMALIEAMALGVPVASADCGGPREILAPNSDPLFKTDNTEFADYGVLLPSFDGRKRGVHDKLSREENVWVETISRLLSDRDILDFYSGRARKRSMDFSPGSVKERWFSFLDKIV